MVSLSRTLSLGLFLAALGLAGATLAAAQPKEPNGGGKTAQPPQSPPDARAALAKPPAANTANKARSEKPKPKPPTIRQRAWRWVWRFGRDPIAVLTLALFILGGWQIEISRRTAKRQLRAYVSATPNFAVAFDAAHPAGGRYRLLNHGETPAHDVQHRGTIALFPNPIPQDFTPPPLTRPWGERVVIFPDANITGSCAAPRSFTNDEITALRNGDLAVYLHGEVTYLDVFGTRRGTRFCSQIVADAKTMQKLTSNYEPTDLEVVFSVAPFGNDAE